MEIKLKNGVKRKYRFSNKKYSKMLYKGNLKKISLDVEALYRVETLSSNEVKINFLENRITSDDSLSVLLNECNEIFEEMIFNTDESGKIKRVTNKETILKNIEQFELNKPEKYKMQTEKDVLRAISNVYRESLKDPVFEERFLDSGIIGLMFSGIYGHYNENIRRIRRNLRNIFSLPLAVEIYQSATGHIGNNEIELIVKGNLDNVYLKDMEIHEIMQRQLNYSKHKIDLSYSGNYKLELDTGFIKKAYLMRKFKYGDDYVAELTSEMIQYE